MSKHSLTKLIFQGLKWYHYTILLRNRDNPKSMQQRILRRLITANKTTEFGVKHQFANISTYDQFKQYVPIRTAAQYTPYLSKVYEGNDNVLTKQAPYFFAMTAGSTGAYKYIPINKPLKKELDRSVMSFYYLLEKHCPNITKAPIQFLVGSAEGGQSPGGVPQGFVSGFNYKHLPKPIRDKFVIPYWVFTLENAEDRYYAMARFLVAHRNLAAITAISPQNISNIANAIINNADQLLTDLKKGTLTLSSTNQAKASAQRFVVDEKLNHTIEQAFQQLQTGTAAPALMALLFPNLDYFVTWMGGNMQNAMEELFTYFGRKPVFEMPYSASEGIFAIPLELNQRGGVAAINGHFLEYIPEEDIDKPQPRSLGVWELEKDRYYYQIVTTTGGLYRYNMEDLIRVNGFWGRTPIVEFISKKSRQISIANERLNENDVTEATHKACAKYNLFFKNFMLVPSRDKHYRFLIEEDTANLKEFASSLERELQNLSKGYYFEREDQLLEPLEICVVKPGQLQDYMQNILHQSNLPNAQTKPLHLSNEFDGHKQFIILKCIRA